MYHKFLPLLLLFYSMSFAQVDTVKTINYAGNIINVPDGYTAESEYQINTDGFSAQWLYFPKEVSIKDLNEHISPQFEEQLALKELEKITFTSSGSDLIGKKYLFDDKSYIILGFGVVNGQTLMLNMHFTEEPLKNDQFDNLIKNFILFYE